MPYINLIAILINLIAILIMVFYHCRTQLCINTAIVYMQRFYMFHSFHRFHRNSIASASLFLAAKVT